MQSIRELIMTFSKAQQYRRCFISFKSLSCNPRIVPKPFIVDKLLQNTSCKISSVHEQATVNFSTSRFLRSDIKTMSEGDTKNFNLYYEDIVKAQNNDNILIIDVREQSEIDETGKLPGSIHIPMGDVANALISLSERDFKDRFAKDKPSKDTKIILSCRSGKRSGMVQEEIQKMGYGNAYNYVGGWLDWESNQKV